MNEPRRIDWTLGPDDMPEPIPATIDTARDVYDAETGEVVVDKEAE